MPYSLIDVDIGAGEHLGIGGDVPSWSTGALVVARRHGVPVGSALVHGPSATARLDHLLETRRGDPAPWTDGAAPSITIAICSRDRPERLARCLRSISEARTVAGSEVVADVLVIDNASSDGRTGDVALAHGADVRREHVPGLDVARNHAARACRGDVLAFVDDDVVVDRMWLRTLGRTLRAHPDALAVTGGVLALRLDTSAQIEFERCGGFFKSWAAGPVDGATHSRFPFKTSTC
jgi:hypothetical protein